MYRMQYLIPDGFGAVDGKLDQEISRLGALLKGVDIKGANVPNSALWVQLKIVMEGACFMIKKRDQLVYSNFFSFTAVHFDNMFALVEALYIEFGLGSPKRPKVPTWIHSVPAAHHLLRENEIRLCQKLTVSFFWATFAQALKKQTLN